MSDDRLDELLSRLCDGDGSAAEEVFRAYEPYLRMVVRRRLPDPMRANFDSSDVVQSVWADLVVGFRERGWRFASAAQLRAFLVKATRNRFLDRARQNQRRTAREQTVAVDGETATVGREPHPSELVQAAELWQQMLELCPPQHHRLLTLKRQGASLAEIAEQTGLHESSVRRILYELARSLAARRSQAQGDE
jgi:RNA polymerase sigma factor (sigma-70 family)